MPAPLKIFRSTGGGDVTGSPIHSIFPFLREGKVSLWLGRSEGLLAVKKRRFNTLLSYPRQVLSNLLKRRGVDYLFTEVYFNFRSLNEIVLADTTF